MSRPLLERNVSLVHRSLLSQANKDVILRFADDCLAEGLGVLRVAKYMTHLRTLGRWLDRDFSGVAMTDMKRLVATIETAPISPHTKSDHKVALRKFYKWLSGSGECPEVVRWIRARGPRHKRLLPTSLLTEDDVKLLVAASDHPRDRALVALLYESGARAGEVLGLRIGHLSFDRFGAQADVNGKTGPRRIRLISCVPYLTEWLNRHPRTTDPNAFLWVTRDHRVAELGYQRFRHTLQSLARRAQIKKPVNPHHFRHSRATFLANHLTDAQLKEYLGWVQSSEMAAVYVHLSGRDVDNAILKLHGLQNADDSSAPRLTVKTCSRCECANQYTNSFCSKCGLALDEEAKLALIRRDLDRNKSDAILDRLLEDDEFRNDLMTRVAALTRSPQVAGAEAPPAELTRAAQLLKYARPIASRRAGST